MNYARLVPPDTFIGRYLDAASVLETSQSYDFWCALWALGSCIGRSVYVPRPHAPVYLNWYVMLVAESGVTRKSTAVRLARDIVSQFLGAERMVEGRCTPEYLFELLTREPHTAIAVSELVTFLGRESYVIELPALLTDLYDCPPERRGGSVTRGERIISNAFVTFVTASTPSWLQTSVNPTVVEGGFTSRCLFVHDEKPKQKVAWPSASIDTDHVRDLLHQAVKSARDVQKIELMPAAMKRFESWYRQRDTSSMIPFVSSFNSREDAHVLRAAACLAINDGTMAINVRHINVAVKLIAAVKAGAINIFQDGGTVIKSAQGIDRITKLLIEAGPLGIPHTRLYTAVRYYMQRDDFHITMDLMSESGMVQPVIENRLGGGRKGVRYIAGDGMRSRTKMDALKQAFT
jgi:hypothetical protein